MQKKIFFASFLFLFTFFPNFKLGKKNRLKKRKKQNIMEGREKGMGGKA